jgi:hypothetical protein
MQKTIKLGAYGLIIWQKYEIVKVQKRNLNPHFEAFISNWNLLFHLSLDIFRDSIHQLNTLGLFERHYLMLIL